MSEVLTLDAEVDSMQDVVSEERGALTKQAVSSVFGTREDLERRRNAGYCGKSMWGGGGVDLAPQDPGSKQEGCVASRSYDRGLCCP